MSSVVGNLDLLRTALETAQPPDVFFSRPERPNPQYGIWRLFTSWKARGLFGSDEAVLLRQFLRWLDAPLFLKQLGQEVESTLERAGVGRGPDGSIVAAPYSPSWLRNASLLPQGIDHLPEWRRTDEHVPCEGYRPGRSDEWHSQAQKEAVWAAIAACPGDTLLVALPTGAGKSTCFHLVPWTSSGLTVVVVPTVALGIDQFRRAESVLHKDPSIKARYCASGDPDGDPVSIADDIRHKRTRLVFASPEACVSGTLKIALHEAARSGWLNTLVIDEAHLIETWGMYFRVDFQLLASERRRWWEASGGQLRTMLLSATFTPSCREVLQEFFGGPGKWKELVSQRLRPEIEYYATKFNTSAEQNSAVLDALWHLPRPCIFYTTEPDRAEELANLFRAEGFARVECFHGETDAFQRRKIIKQWTNDEIDVMAATSAFGVGVDKGDIRTVVHACLPENLNRFYQEVGRGGRDGYSSLSILMPSAHDFEVAKGLTPTLMKPESLKDRWDAMLNSGEYLGDGSWKLRPAAKRTSLVGTRTGNQNVLWNKRLLLQLKRSKLLEIQEIGFTHDEENPSESDWVRVRPLFAPHTPDLGTSIEPVRQRELAVLRNGLEEMYAVFNTERCLSRRFHALYGSDTVRVCGSCANCRATGRRISGCPPLPIDESHSTNPETFVVENWPDPFRNAERYAARELIRSAYLHKKIRRFVCDSTLHVAIMKFISEALSSDVIRPFRVDALGAETPGFIVHPEESLLVLHIGSLVRGAEGLRVGKLVIHAISSIDGRDENGRHFLESEGSRLLHDPKFLF